MKTLLFILCLSVIPLLFRRRRLAGNDAESILANAADGGSPFAILQPDGFLVPYGQYPHKQGLQIFDRAAAEGIVASHNSALSKLVRHFGGGSYPVYVGHPDLPGTKDTDKRAYGWIENLTVTDNGLHLSVKWSEAGRELVENAHFKFYSPLWWTKKVKGGIRPVALKSMGLTNDPNIPVPALANEAEEETEESRIQNQEEESQTENEQPMNEMLAALGLEEGATPEAALAKITELTTAANEAATRVTELENERDGAVNTLTTFRGELLSAQSERDAARSSLAIAANHAVQIAVNSGRLTPAEAEEKSAEILAANDFAAALQDLGKLPARVKTESATGDLGQAKSRLVVAANDESKARREERAQLVENEFQATNPALSTGERKRIAWERARRKNPEVFGKAESTGTAA